MNWKLSWGLTSALQIENPKLLKGMSDYRLKDALQDFLAQATAAETLRFHGW